MKQLKASVCCLCAAICLLSTFPAEAYFRSLPSPIDQIFDEYGDLSWENEKARLDNFAIALQQNPEVTGYIYVYAGRRACRGEAQAHAIRAKKYVVEVRGVKANRILLRDGGYREELSVNLVLAPPGAPELQAVPTVNPNEIESTKKCKKKRGKS